MAPVRTRTRSRGSSRSAPYKRRAAKAPAKTIKKIVAFMKNNKPEIKQAKYTTGAALNSGSIVSWNIAHHMLSQGVGQNQYLGKKLNLKWLTVKYYIDNAAIHNITGGSGNLDTIVKIYIIATKTFQSTASLSGSDIYDTQFTGNTAYCSMIDSDKCKVLAARTVRFQPHLAAISSNLQGPPMVRYGKINFRFNRTFEFKDWNTNAESKMWNYYIVVTTNSQGLGGGDAPGMVKTNEIGLKAKLSFSDD